MFVLCGVRKERLDCFGTFCFYLSSPFFFWTVRNLPKTKTYFNSKYRIKRHRSFVKWFRVVLTIKGNTYKVTVQFLCIIPKSSRRSWRFEDVTKPENLFRVTSRGHKVSWGILIYHDYSVFQSYTSTFAASLLNNSNSTHRYWSLKTNSNRME